MNASRALRVVADRHLQLAQAVEQGRRLALLFLRHILILGQKPLYFLALAVRADGQAVAGVDRPLVHLLSLQHLQDAGAELAVLAVHLLHFRPQIKGGVAHFRRGPGQTGDGLLDAVGVDF